MVDNVDIDVWATDMVELYADALRQTDEGLGLTQEGMNNLFEYFGTVPIESRGDTFVAFVKELDKQGLPYDMSAFQRGPANASVH